MTHPPPSVAPPAAVHTHSHAVMARFDGGGMRYLKDLLVVRKHPVGLSWYIPRTRGMAIVGSVDHLT